MPPGVQIRLSLWFNLDTQDEGVIDQILYCWLKRDFEYRDRFGCTYIFEIDMMAAYF